MKIVLIGAGNIAASHVEAFRYAGTDISGVSTRSERGRKFAEQHGIPFFTPSIPELIETCQPDAVLVLTQPGAYLPILQALQPYNLPTFLEKPLGYAVVEAQALRPYLPQTAFVGLNRRFYGNVQAIQPMLLDEPPFMAQLTLPERLRDFQNRDEITRTHWHMMNSIHGIDLVHFLAGPLNQVESLQQWGKLEATPLPQYTMGTYTTTRQNRVVFMSNLDSPGGWRLHFYLKQREIMLAPIEKTLVKTLSGVEELPPTELDTLGKPGFIAQAQTFLAGLRQPTTLPAQWVSFDSALDSMRLVETLFQTGQAARIPIEA